MPRYRLGMVAGGHRHDTGGSLLPCEQRHPVGGATLFKGACHLQRVELKPNIRPGQAADRVAVDDGRSNHLAGNAPGSRYNLFIADQLSVLSSIPKSLVMAEHFAWNGQTYDSLSKVAFAITGSRWNGPRFFGLRGKEYRSALEVRP
jgi:hypothetical protein